MMKRDRGTILLAVLVVITISALAGTTAMYFGEAASSAARVSLKRTKSRALAWSGMQAVMAELADQRDDAPYIYRRQRTDRITAAENALVER